MLEAHWNGSRTLPLITLIGLLAVILYVISVVDVVPDTIPILGYMDDAAVLCWSARIIRDEMNSFRRWKEGLHGQ